VNDFHALHQQVYSYSEPDEVVEFINLRVRIKGKNPPLSLAAESEKGPSVEESKKAVRPVYFEGTGWQEIPVYEREWMPAGSQVRGPCMIEETISTALVPHGFKGSIDAYRNIIMEQEDQQ
jgi:N-methylhydantoinase A